MATKYNNTKIDAMPNLIGPAYLFMLASATKSVVFLSVAAGVAVIFNIPSIFQGDPFWKKRERVFAALLALPICIWLFFWIEDIAAQTVAFLLTLLCYGVLVLFIEFWNSAD